MVSCIVVCLQARLDEFALRLGEELGSLGIVMNEPIGEYGDDYGQDALLQEC